MSLVHFSLVNVIFTSEEVKTEAVLSNFLLLDIGNNFLLCRYDCLK